MQIVVSIAEEEYESIKKHPHWHSLGELIANGTPLPKGHGRLIDEGVLKNQFPIWVDNFSSYGVNKTISKTPTIIEADKGDE